MAALAMVRERRAGMRGWRWLGDMPVTWSGVSSRVESSRCSREPFCPGTRTAGDQEYRS